MTLTTDLVIKIQWVDPKKTPYSYERHIFEKINKYRSK